MKPTDAGRLALLPSATLLTPGLWALGDSAGSGQQALEVCLVCAGAGAMLMALAWHFGAQDRRSLLVYGLASGLLLAVGALAALRGGL